MFLALLLFLPPGWSSHQIFNGGVMRFSSYTSAEQGGVTLGITCEHGILRVYLEMTEPILTEKTPTEYFFDDDESVDAQWLVPKKNIVLAPAGITTEILQKMAQAKTLSVKVAGRLAVFDLEGWEEARMSLDGPCDFP